MISDKPAIIGDDPVDNSESDWFGFTPHAIELSDNLFKIGQVSSVCCGVVGPWGSGKTSFLKLMYSHVSDNQNRDGIVPVWLIAWNPGQEGNLGDIILYQIYESLLEYVKKNKIGDAKSLDDQLGVLKKSLGERSGFMEQAKDVASLVGRSILPDTIKDVAKVSEFVIDRIQASREMRNSFQVMFDYLTKHKLTLFIFIDELDRTEGKQIYQLLSELKSYLIYKNTIVVISYDDHYLTNAIRNQIPDNVEPNVFLEKIITVKKTLPAPNFDQLNEYGTMILQQFDYLEPTMLDLLHELTEGNIRKFKRLLLSFLHYIPYIDEGYPQDYCVISLLALQEIGGLSDSYIVKMIMTKREDAFSTSITELDNKYPGILDWYNQVKEYYIFSNLSEVMHLFNVNNEDDESKSSESTGFNWKGFLKDILPIIISNGVFLTPNETNHANEIELKGTVIDLSTFFVPDQIEFILTQQTQSDVFYLLSSDDPDEEYFVEDVYSQLPLFVKEKPAVIWIIDDLANRYNSYESLLDKIKELTVGLKHKLTLLYTPRSKITNLSQLLSRRFS